MTTGLSTHRDMTSKNFIDQIDSWHARRVSTLTNDYGWLTLIAFEWLKEGLNSVHNVCTITVQRGKVSAQISDGLSATVADKPFVSGVLKTEADSKGPDRVKVGSKVFVILKRGERFALRMWDTNAESRKHFRGIERYPVSEQWKIDADWEQYKTSKTVRLSTPIPSYTADYKIPGIATFSVRGNSYRLEPIMEEGSEQLFFIFLDGTSGAETNVDGRYLYASIPEKGIVVLDFNKAINPPSAFTPFATSPLAPESNRLRLRIEAGEKKYSV